MIEIFWTIWIIVIIASIALMVTGTIWNNINLTGSGGVILVVCALALFVGAFEGENKFETFKPRKIGKSVGITIAFIDDAMTYRTTDKASIYELPDSSLCIRRKYETNMFGVDMINRYSFVRCEDGDND